MSKPEKRRKGDFSYGLMDDIRELGEDLRLKIFENAIQLLFSKRVM